MTSQPSDSPSLQDTSAEVSSREKNKKTDVSATGNDNHFRPVYTKIRTRTPFCNLLTKPMPLEKPSTISEKCACWMLTTIAASLLIGVLSLTLTLLFGVGVFASRESPRTDTDRSLFASSSTSLLNSLNNLKLTLQSREEETKEILKQQKQSINELRTRLQGMANRNTKSRDVAIQTLPEAYLRMQAPTDLSAMFKRLNDTISLFYAAQCNHEEFSIGISASQEVADSGEYYADQGYVITGVTCSSSFGFIGSLESRVTWSDDSSSSQTFYKCKCTRIFSHDAPSNGRAECKINYWECARG